MKKYFALLFGAFAISALIFSSCVKKKDCFDCDAEGIVKQTFIVGDSGSITIYPVITPLNYDFCDSFVLYNGTYVEPYRVPKYNKKKEEGGEYGLRLCTNEEAQKEVNEKKERTCVCRENPATKDNDTKEAGKEGINNFLYIEGITNFQYNKLFIKQDNDTTKNRTYINYDNTGDTFNGLVLDTMDVEFISSKMLRSGKFKYELILYKDEAHQVAIDTIIGNFFIVRSKKDCNINCLKHARDQRDTELLH